MRSDWYQKHSVQTISWKFVHRLILLILISNLGPFLIAQISAETFQQRQLESESVQLGELSNFNGSAVDFGTIVGSQDGARLRTSRLSSVTAKRDPIAHVQKPAVNNVASNKQTTTTHRQQDDVASTNCLAKQNEILRRQSHTTAPPARPTTASLPAGLQRLKPKNEAGLSAGSTTIVLNETFANNFDGEHIPRCRQDGSYEPVQCHKIGYCWCVNKFGQAIKNSAVMSGEEAFCDSAMYESDSNDLLVVAGISAQRMKGFLKPGGSPVESTTPNGHINFEATESSGETTDGEGNHQQVESGKRLGTLEPTMPLIPNDCEGSRANARERAMKHVNDSIWVPECDNEDEKLYAERQCHKSRVCWCVDQASGLPLKTSEQLSARTAHKNCTEIRRVLGLTGGANGKQGFSAKPAQPAFFQGSSEFCDADKRIEFVVTLNNQFRQQISEYLRQNPSGLVPPNMNSQNPFTISDTQVSKWKFNIMDKDLDGKLGDREWSKFKNNFKLVDKPDELENPFKLQKSPYFTLTPLLIVRSQRKCWRDFLEFCGNGDLVDESISLSKWFSCTEVPPKSLHDEQQSRRQGASSLENTYAHSREAAIVRSKKKNPFLGILKPD